MARSHARIDTGIWNDRDFKALSRDGQWLYQLLLGQPDLGHSGLLSITVRRWARLSSDGTKEAVSEALYELAAARFIVLDEDTEELLVRTLVRNDGAWKQPKVLGVAITEASRISSAYLRAEFTKEMRRLDLASLPEKTPDRVKEQIRELLDTLPRALTEAHLELEKEGGQHPPEDPPRHPPAKGLADVPAKDASQARPATRSQGGAEGGRGRVRAQAAPAPTPTPAFTPPAADAAAPPRGGSQATQDTLDGGPPPEPQLTPTQRSKRITDAYAAAEPFCKWQAVNAIIVRAIEARRWPDEQIQAACLRLAARRASVTINNLRDELEGQHPSNVHRLRPTGTDSRGGAFSPVNDIDWSKGFNMGGDR